MQFGYRFCIYVCIAALYGRLAAAQCEQPSQAASLQATDSQATSLLAHAAAALRGNGALSDVTLTGTARRIVGPDDESGQVEVRARSTGQSRVDLNFASGKYSEIRDAAPCFGLGSSTSAVPSGQWIGPDGTVHDIVYHNLVAEPAWHSPALFFGQLLVQPSLVVTNLGQETRDGATVQHISTTQTATGSSETDQLLQHLSQFDIYLDPVTALPVIITFNIHPDNNALVDLPVEIRFSDYRTVGSVQIPFHIQKFLNNTLILELQFGSAKLNSGLLASDFALQ